MRTQSTSQLILTFVVCLVVAVLPLALILSHGPKSMIPLSLVMVGIMGFFITATSLTGKRRLVGLLAFALTGLVSLISLLREFM